jgi:hypothetical protein
MADGNGKQGDGTVLVAWVTVHLESGERFELLPFEDAQDVKSKVSALIGDWAKSGFLIRGSEIIPWHRVQRVEATKVEELSRSDSKKRLEEWQAKDTARLQQSFWKTKQAKEKKDEGAEGENAGGHGSQRTAA